MLREAEAQAEPPTASPGEWLSCQRQVPGQPQREMNGSGSEEPPAVMTTAAIPDPGDLQPQAGALLGLLGPTLVSPSLVPPDQRGPESPGAVR